jgi:hypothetical protein
MEYKTAKPSLQDIQTKSVRLVAKVQELGAFTTTVITIPLADLSDTAIEVGDVHVCNNVTDATVAVPTIVGSNLLLTAGGATTFAATDIIDLAIRLK